jgi:hypothetical protein
VCADVFGLCPSVFLLAELWYKVMNTPAQKTLRQYTMLANDDGTVSYLGVAMNMSAEDRYVAIS